MRGVVDGLTSPTPLASELPAVYQEEDPFSVRLVEAFDAELAPIIATLDNLSAYFDPRLTPEDFLDWLASWVALELDETWDVDRRRAAILAAVDVLRRRGTAAGLADELRLATDSQIEVFESGGSAWSLDPMSPMVGSAELALHIRVLAADPSQVDVDRLDRVVRSAKPAHVPHRIEVVGVEPPKKARAKAETKAAAEAKTTKPGTSAAAGEPSGGAPDAPADDQGSRSDGGTTGTDG
jgi:phage tail-like protein